MRRGRRPHESRVRRVASTEPSAANCSKYPLGRARSSRCAPSTSDKSPAAYRNPDELGTPRTPRRPYRGPGCSCTGRAMAVRSSGSWPGSHQRSLTTLVLKLATPDARPQGRIASCVDAHVSRPNAMPSCAATTQSIDHRGHRYDHRYAMQTNARFLCCDRRIVVTRRGSCA